MLRILRPAMLSTLMLCSLPMVVFAQGGPGGTTPSSGTITEGPDTGTILSTTAPIGKVNCWISRSSSAAIAVTVYQEPSNLAAKLRMYSKEEEEYSSKKTRIKISETDTQEFSVVTVKLELVEGSQDTYTMTLETSATPVKVGFLRFGKGTKGRKSSDVVIRLASAVEGSVNPCDKPPIDDLGEEEEMPVGSNSSPGPSLAFLPM